jgi:hypothetical protein
MKLVRCLRGSVFDVLIDLRPESPTFLQWHGEILSAANLKMLCVPEGFAHGFQVLEPDSELLYLTTAFYVPDAEGGLRYDDPAVGIEWPLTVTEISQRDASHPYLNQYDNSSEATAWDRWLGTLGLPGGQEQVDPMEGAEADSLGFLSRENPWPWLPVPKSTF